MAGVRNITSGGERLRRLRNRYGLTQQAVADRISLEGEGPDKPAISRIETGYNRAPERATLQRILDAIEEARFSEKRVNPYGAFRLNMQARLPGLAA